MPHLLDQPSIPGINPMIPQPFRVRRRRQENADTFTLEIEPAGIANPFAFSPGQFNMLYVFGVGEVPISICGHSEGRRHTIAHTTRAVGTVTRAMAKLKRGELLGVRGPFGSSWPTEAAVGHDVVLVAGGIGLAPLRPVIDHLLRRRRKTGRVVLLCGARTPEDLLYARQLEHWGQKCEVHVTVDRATGAWRGDIGVITTLIPRIPFDPQTAIAMVCGPEIMMRFTVRELQKRGVTENRIFLSLERNMKCATGFCGHCQFGPEFICKDGPVFRYDRVRSWLEINEL
ncbi:MAG: FAD/NAD(P)-binding protein [Terrimicrobiaceae bacterium]